MPTLVTPRSERPSSARHSHRSPGRAVSMSRIDQLARPRQQAGGPAALADAAGGGKRSPSKSVSMCHLAAPPVGGGGGPARQRARSKTQGHRGEVGQQQQQQGTRRARQQGES